MKQQSSRLRSIVAWSVMIVTVIVVSYTVLDKQEGFSFRVASLAVFVLSPVARWMHQHIISAEWMHYLIQFFCYMIPASLLVFLAAPSWGISLASGLLGAMLFCFLLTTMHKAIWGWAK